jgi:hypothetical protein
MGRQSEIEEEFARQLDWSRVPYKREVAIHPDRRWRVDFLIKDRLFVEINGGIWRAKGAHNTGKALIRDYAKLNILQALGYPCFCFTADSVSRGTALQFVLDYFENNPEDRTRPAPDSGLLQKYPDSRGGVGA